MKRMTCKQLGGACDLEFEANTFDEMAKLSKEHGTEMFMKKDAAHLTAMNKMREMMHTPDGMKQWMDSKRSEFDGLPELS